MLPPLTFTPQTSRRITHDARRAVWSVDGDMLVVIGASSEFSVLDRELDVVIDGRVRHADLRAAAVDAERGQLAFCGKDALITTDFEASAVTTHTHRPWGKNEGGDALFTEDGALLTICPSSDGEVAVQLRDPDSGLVHLEARPDLPSGTRAWLARTRSPRAFLVWIPGDDAGQTLRCVIGDTLTLTPVDALGHADHGPLVLGPTGAEATRVHDGAVERWRLGAWRSDDDGPRRLGVWRPEDDGPFFDDPALVRPSAQLAFVGNDQLLIVDEASGRPYLLELESMLIAHELRLDDLEPPIRQVVPEHLGEGFVVAHGADPSSTLLSLFEPPFGEVS